MNYKDELNKDYEEVMKKKLDNPHNERDPTDQSSLEEYTNIRKVEERVRKTYGQQWDKYNYSKTREELIAEWLILELLRNLEEPKRFLGRPSVSIQDKLFCMFTYCYEGKSSRATTAKLLRAKRYGLISQAPHFNTVCSMFRDRALTKLLLQLVEITALPLRQFEKTASVDSTGFSVYNYKRWFDIRTQDYRKKKEWVKLHLIVGNVTNVVMSAVVSEATRSDAKELVPLAKKATKHFALEEVSADKAYLGRPQLTGIAKLGAVLYVPFKSNSTSKSRGCPLWTKMYNYFRDHQEEYMKHYHLRSNSETTFAMIKRKYRNNVRMKTYTGQMNELLMKTLCHNISVLIEESIKLGIEIDFRDCFKTYFENGGRKA